MSRTPDNNTCPYGCGARLALTEPPLAGRRYHCVRCRRSIVVVGAAVASDGTASVSFDVAEGSR